MKQEKIESQEVHESSNEEIVVDVEDEEDQPEIVATFQSNDVKNVFIEDDEEDDSDTEIFGN